MLKFLLFFTIHLFISIISLGQLKQNAAAVKWADSVYKTLTSTERIAQLMVVRLSSIDSKTKQVSFYDKQVAELIKKYNIGGVLIFQGSPVKQANIMNGLQSIAKTPLLMCIDGEWGVGMRLDSVLPLPKQMMLGAMQDEDIVYKYGRVVAEQCKRMGIQVNYAPVVDVNNNPNNPVINDRSFGEDKYKVSRYGICYMEGMQDMGVMACAKHFPGHGDVAVDSHLDLPVINKSLAQLDSLELYPFRQIFNAGVGSVMIAHLYIPAIDSATNRATSLSKNNITGLMRNKLGYKGLTFTDALEMQGVKKFFPNGEAAVESLIAGNDMLCLPEDVPQAIDKIKEAIKNKKLSWADIRLHCQKVLMAKYEYGLSNLIPINTQNLTADLNSQVSSMRRLVAENAITLLSKKNDSFFPLTMAANNKPKDIAYLAFGINISNGFAKRMQADYNADVFYFDIKKSDSVAYSTLLRKINKEYKKIVLGIHNINRAPANNFGISKQMAGVINNILAKNNAIGFLFGNAYALKKWCNAQNLVACYEDDFIIQNTAIDMLQGKISYKGTLPVTVCDNYKYGFGLAQTPDYLPRTDAVLAGFSPAKLSVIDSIVNDAINRKVFPGCVVLAAKNGQIAYEKAFGNFTYSRAQAVTTDAVYDLASITKMSATTLAVMKLYEQGKIDLKKTLGYYLPWVRGSNKEYVTLEKLLLHQGGLAPYIFFYKETVDVYGQPYPGMYSSDLTDTFSIKVANNLFMRKDWKDTIYKRILNSPLGPEKFVYSDFDFIFLGDVVEAVTGATLDAYVQKEFYTPMNLTTMGFHPLHRIPVTSIVPTEEDKKFRQQLLQGIVHDPAAAMFGGVSGHAGLFSNAYDLAVVMQMLLNGGVMNERRFLKKETIDLFTSYRSFISRRGFGFDKPEKDNAYSDDPYPCKSASPLAFGHTGFTGTGAWADPANNLVYILLSNRVYPDGNDAFNKMRMRPKISEAVYRALDK